MTDLEAFGRHVGTVRTMESFRYVCPRCGVSMSPHREFCKNCNAVFLYDTSAPFWHEVFCDLKYGTTRAGTDRASRSFISREEELSNILTELAKYRIELTFN